MTGEYDIIFLLTKQQSNAEVIQFLLPFLGADGVVCTLQNGVPEPELAAAAGPARILGGTVEWGAEMTSPGICLLTSPPGNCSFRLGGLPGLNDSRLRQAKEILELMCPTFIDQNFVGVRWAKLLINASFSGMSVVLGCTFGQVADNRRAREVLQMVMKECIDTAAASGVAIESVQGTNIAAVFGFSGPIKKWVAFHLIPFAIRKHRDVTASMLQDIQKGKKTEVDAINGVVCETAQKVNVATPYNQMVVRIVHEFEEGNGRPGFENLARFDEINRQ
jgi:2-dehydropantoate 2-reductase